MLASCGLRGEVGQVMEAIAMAASSDEQLIRTLLSRSEGEKLDFKAEQYRLESDHLKSKFVKDVVCMANADGDPPGYIVLGVKSYPDGRKEVLDVRVHHDDAAFQALVKDKVDPVPRFIYRSVAFESVSLGLVEIPRSYSRPHLAMRDFGCLRKGITYTRHGSTNTEATREEMKAMYSDSAGWSVGLYASHFDGAAEARRLVQGLKTRVLDTSVSVAQVVLECRDLATMLDMGDEHEWLEAELNGYAIQSLGYRTLADLMEAKPGSPLAERAGWRMIEIELWAGSPGSAPVRLPWPYFFVAPIHLVEERIQWLQKTGRVEEGTVLRDEDGTIAEWIADTVEQQAQALGRSDIVSMWADIVEGLRSPRRRPGYFPIKPGALSAMLPKLRQHLLTFVQKAEGVLRERF